MILYSKEPVSDGGNTPLLNSHKKTSPSRKVCMYTVHNVLKTKCSHSERPHLKNVFIVKRPLARNNFYAQNGPKLYFYFSTFWLFWKTSFYYNYCWTFNLFNRGIHINIVSFFISINVGLFLNFWDCWSTHLELESTYCSSHIEDNSDERWEHWLVL